MFIKLKICKMENQIYRAQLTNGGKLELYVCTMNEINPYRNIKELGVSVLGKVIQLDGNLGLNELDSLISYLQDCREYIKEYNENSKPCANNQSEQFYCAEKYEVGYVCEDGPCDKCKKVDSI